ncbi:MAG: hypothetical protein QGF59_30490 [Pirellulaceae bacterium]|nr:hypothetical protein [Pirellulaceae bacterium]
MIETQTTPHDWNRLAKLPRGTEINITLEDGTPDGTLAWWYQADADGGKYWIVQRKDNEGHQWDVELTTTRRAGLAATLGEMGSETIAGYRFQRRPRPNHDTD